jgi:ribonuclease HI
MQSWLTRYSQALLPQCDAIEHGLELIKLGIVWRVGLGSKIQIWHDPWLPRVTSGKVTLKRGRAHLRWVSQLMVPGRKEWDVPLLNSVLYPHDAQEVMKIRLSARVPEDHVAWFYETSDLFSARSAYHLAVSMDKPEGNQESCSARADGTQQGFKCIWSAKVPPKVKVFAWRLCQDGLSTQSNRKTRGLEQCAMCQVCGREDEIGYHAVVCCPKAVALRYELRKGWRIPDEKHFRFTGPDWLHHLLSTIDDDSRDNTLLLFWRAWHHRNYVMHGKGRATIRESVEFLRNYVVELGGKSSNGHAKHSEKGKEKMPDAATEQHGVLKGWSLPSSGWAKISPDAGFCQDTGQAGCGAVVRNHHGEILLTAWMYLQNVALPEEAEALACLEGLRVAAEWVRQPLQVELDCLRLIMALRSSETNRASWQGIISEIKDLCQLFPDYSFAHVRREGNQVAHGVAKLALRKKQCIVKRFSIPQEVVKLVNDDLNASKRSNVSCNHVG